MTILGEDYEFGNIKEEGVPCKNTLQNWVSKVGFFYLQESDNQIFNNRTGYPYSVVNIKKLNKVKKIKEVKMCDKRLSLNHVKINLAKIKDLP